MSNIKNVKYLIYIEANVNWNKGKILKLISLEEVYLQKMCGTRGSDPISIVFNKDHKHYIGT